ncbi:MAG TPA: hypothetical protein VF838_14400 [Trebonia sp.]
MVLVLVLGAALLLDQLLRGPHVPAEPVAAELAAGLAGLLREPGSSCDIAFSASFSTLSKMPMISPFAWSGTEMRRHSAGLSPLYVALRYLPAQGAATPPWTAGGGLTCLYCLPGNGLAAGADLVKRGNLRMRAG